MKEGERERERESHIESNLFFELFHFIFNINNLFTTLPYHKTNTKLTSHIHFVFFFLLRSTKVTPNSDDNSNYYHSWLHTIPTPPSPVLNSTNRQRYTPRFASIKSHSPNYYPLMQANLQKDTTFTKIFVGGKLIKVLLFVLNNSSFVN